MPKLSHLETKTLRRKQNIISRYLASLVMTTIVVVASFRLFRPIEASITNIELRDTGMYVSTYVIPNEDLLVGSLKITLESTSSYQEWAIGVGESTGYFSELVYGRTYKIKIKGDVGYGIQTFYEQTYYLRKVISIDTSFSQYENTLYYTITGYDLFNTIVNDTFYVDIYEETKFIRRDTFTINEFNNLDGYGELLDIKTDGVKYHVKVRYDYRNDEALLYESSYKTTTNPIVDGEVFGGIDYLGYYLYVTDFASKIKHPDVLIEILGDGYQYTETINIIDSGYMIQNQLVDMKVGYYTIVLYLDLGKGLESYYKKYVEVGAETQWAN